MVAIAVTVVTSRAEVPWWVKFVCLGVVPGGQPRTTSLALPGTYVIPGMTSLPVKMLPPGLTSGCGARRRLPSCSA